MICYLYEPSIYLFYAPNLPGLLYYSHVSAIVGALIIGLFVFVNGRKTLLNKLLFSITAAFSIWTVTNLISWTNNNQSEVTSFLWPLFAGAAALISLLSIYFVEVFVTKRDLSPRTKIGFLLLLFPVFALGFSDFNFSGFDLVNCDPFMFIGVAFQVYYTSLGVIAMMWIAYRLIKGYRTANQDFKKQLVLVGIGIESFLTIFFGSDLLGTYLSKLGLLEDSRIEFFGILSMLVFLTFISILIVRFKAFNIRILAPYALIVALVFLVGTQYTYATTLTGTILTSVTLSLVCIVGVLLVRSVQKEVKARELIEKQKIELEQANIQQESLIRFIGHEMKGYLTTSAGVFASIVEGDFNPISDMLKSSAEAALTRVREGVRSVVEILSNANAKKGTLAYKMQPFDFGKMILAAIVKLSPDAKEKGLAVETDIQDDGSYRVMGDTDQISEHVVRNLIDNSIKYTPAGSVHVSLSKKDGKVLLSIRDTGVGITAEDKVRLFTEGGRGKDSLSVNVHSTGYGLAIAKKIVDAHSGRIWAESEGKGKGSQFYVELPEAK